MSDQVPPAIGPTYQVRPEELRPHPGADVVPPLTDGELKTLRTSINRAGIREAVRASTDGVIIDGHHRVQIALALGLEAVPVRYEVAPECWEAEMIQRAIERRNLNESVRAALAARLLELTRPTKPDDTSRNADVRYKPSQREICEAARGAGVSPRLVEDAVRVRAEAPDMAGQVERGELTVGGATRLLRERDGAVAHVAHNSGDHEWYTPAEYIEAAREAMGEIDFDPASCAAANKVVQAKKFCTVDNDGLAATWNGRCFLNPPFETALIGKFCAKLLEEFKAGSVTQAVVLVNNATETAWFQTLAKKASAYCFPGGRVRFWAPDKKSSAPLQGQAVLYFGPNVKGFRSAFDGFGFLLVP